MKHNSRGGFNASSGLQVDVVPTIVGDAAISNAFALHHSRLTSATASTSASASAAHSKGRAVPVYLHERGFDIVTEDHYLIAGVPTRLVLFSLT